MINTKTYPSESGMNRRDFLKQSGLASLLAGLALAKPCFARTPSDVSQVENLSDKINDTFSADHKAILKAVQLQLFPADGDGPSAADINAYRYLDWALEDPKNKEDGDRVFIRQGINELEVLTRKAGCQRFDKLDSMQQHRLLQQFADTELGDHWMSLLIYYLMEALLLDPVYGGNTNEAGWKWLEHQPGFPRPTAQRNFRHYVKV